MSGEPGAPRATAAWQQADAAHWLHPFTDPKALARVGALVIERGDGLWLETHDGRHLLDAMSGLWCVQVGYGRREIVTAVTRQLERLPYASGFAHLTHTGAIALAERLAALARQPGARVFFTNSGSEATDTAVRLARRYWALQGQPQRRIVLARAGGYHGSTIAAAALSGLPDVRAQDAAADPDAATPAMAPSWWAHRVAARAAGDAPLDAAAFGRLAAADVDARIRALGADRVAAFIAEPVQAAGGVVVPPDGYWPAVEAICRAHGVLLVVDDVVCGFGRLGDWFGARHYGLQPDLVTFAKGVTSGYVPMGGVLVGARVGDVLVQGGDLLHGYTTSGHPAACAAALANLDILEREGLVDRVDATLAARFAGALGTLASHALVGAVETRGLLGALQLVPDRADPREFDADVPVAALAQQAALEHGLLVRAVGTRLVLAPALVIDEPTLDTLVERLGAALDATAQGLEQRGWR